MAEVGPVARHKPCAGAIDFEERAEAVVFQVKEPIWIVAASGSTTSGMILGRAVVAAAIVVVQVMRSP
jgi:hypothetical protein